MRFLRGMLVLVFALMLVFSLAVIAFATLPTEGTVAVPLGLRYEKATIFESVSFPVAITLVVMSITALVMLVADNHTLLIKDADRRIAMVNGGFAVGLKFPFSDGWRYSRR